MKFNIAKVTIPLITAFIFCVTGAAAFASATWLSSITQTEVPTRMALDGKGNLYVTELRDRNRVLVFDRRGNLVRILSGLSEPIGIAVDNDSRIYIGNSGTGSVDVYNSDFTFSFKLGVGNGEVKVPSSIAATSAGLIYVVDSKANIVKAYNRNGAFAFSFGGYGAGNGQFTKPNGIAVDEAAGEMYVSDRGAFTGPNGIQGGARIQVFDLNGVFKRSFGQFGSGPGQMSTPVEIAVDGAGMLYISDVGLGVFHVFTASGSWVETIFGRTGMFDTPLGIEVGKDRRLFIACSNGPSIEVFGLPGYTTMAVAPKALDFTSAQGDAEPAAQPVTVSNDGSGSLDWTAAASTTDGNAWLAVTPAGGTTAASGGTSTVSIGVKTQGLGAGTYSGTVTITAASGAEEKIGVSLTVTAAPAILSVVPASLSFKAQQDGPAPQAQLLNVNNIGSGNMTWTASSDAGRLALTASTSFLYVSPNTAGLVAGTYNHNVTITAPGAQQSPATIPVTVQLIYAGTLKVSSNIENAAFDTTDINGLVKYSGKGKSWSSDEVTPGDYTITFKAAPGYLKPVARKITLKTGQEIAVSGDYRKKPGATHILAGSADASYKENTFFMLPLEPGKLPISFSPFKNADSVRIAAGEFDASGNERLVLTDNKRSIKVYSINVSLGEKTEVAAYSLPEGYSHADAVVGDIDNDGKTEIILGAENVNPPRRVIKTFDLTESGLQERATPLFTEDKEGRFSMALGDVNDDGLLELLLADATTVRAFSVQNARVLNQLWSRSGDYGNAAQVAAGDLNGDGFTEVALSCDTRGADKSPLIVILKGTGEESGVTIEPFKDLGYTRPATVSIGDIDGDLAEEVVAGAGPAESNDPIIRIFKGDGMYAGTAMKPINGKFGVNVGQGMFRQ